MRLPVLLSLLKNTVAHPACPARPPGAARCRRLIEMRNPHVDPINVMQVEILRRLRSQPDNRQLRDALLLTINGVAAGMRNTG